MDFYQGKTKNNMWNDKTYKEALKSHHWFLLIKWVCTRKECLGAPSWIFHTGATWTEESLRTSWGRCPQRDRPCSPGIRRRAGGEGEEVLYSGCTPGSSKKKEPLNPGPKGCEARPPWSSRKTEENLGGVTLENSQLGTHPRVRLVYGYRALRGRCHFTAAGS